MKGILKILAITGMIIVAAGVLLIPIFAATITETEPNDTPAQANVLPNKTMMSATITISDTDYFSIPGINSVWGVIALLDTGVVTGTAQAELTMLGNDGSTVLQSDIGSWENGSGIALQSFADGDADHYLKVNESGNDETIPNYTLRYYDTVVSTQLETEPNDTPASGTLSAFTHEGVLSSTTDVDCFRFAGHISDTMVFALNGDPENDGSSADMQLSLNKPDGSVQKTANNSGVGGNEFIVADLSENGIYAYCVDVAGGTGGATATYHVGLIRDAPHRSTYDLYMPTYDTRLTQLTPPEGTLLFPGDTITIRAAVTNTDIITIPGGIDFRITYAHNDTCLQVISTNPISTDISASVVSWNGLKTNLAPGEVYSVTATFRALQACSDYMSHNVQLPYYVTGTSSNFIYYNIAHMIYLPLVMR